MHTDYLNPVIRQLRDQQVRFAPREKKLEQVGRAEKLLAEIEPQRTYPYDYLCYRITDFRPESFPNVKIAGQAASHDLRLLVEDLSESANIRAESAGEQVLTVEELSKLFNVSTKTISRWRQQGLVSRRFVFDGRKRVGFLRSSVARFAAQNEERVRRGAHFSQLTDEERTRIIDRARRLARAGGCPADVTRRIAKHTGRSVETIRYTLKQFDTDHPALGGEQEEDLSAVSPRRVGRGVGEAVLPNQDEHLPDHQRIAGPADFGIAVGFHPQSDVQPGRCRWHDPDADARVRHRG